MKDWADDIKIVTTSMHRPNWEDAGARITPQIGYSKHEDVLFNSQVYRVSLQFFSQVSVDTCMTQIEDPRDMIKYSFQAELYNMLYGGLNSQLKTLAFTTKFGTREEALEVITEIQAQLSATKEKLL